MQMFLVALLECCAVMSLISFIYMVASPLLSKRYSAKGLYYIWIIIIAGWIFPFRPHFNMNLFALQIPKVEVTAAKYINISEIPKVITTETSITPSITIWLVIFSVWVIGVVGMIAYNVWQHYQLLKMVRRWSEDIEDPQILNLLNTLKVEMEIETNIQIRTCPTIYTPMMIGFFRHIILLPSITIDSDELEFILRHELVHLKRNDLWYKALVSVTTAIHWFNPIVYIMAKAIEVQCEISCDEQVVQDISLEERKQYSEAIIGVVRNGVGIKTALATNFYKDGSFIKTRIFNIMNIAQKKSATIVLLVTLVAIMGSGMVFAFYPERNKQVINVDVKSLESNKFVYLDGPYTFEEGDIIQYNAPIDGYNKEVTVKFVGEYDRTQYFTLMNCYNQNTDNCIEVTQAQAGKYCLLIGNKDEGVLSDIRGTIEITKIKNNSKNG